MYQKRSEVVNLDATERALVVSVWKPLVESHNLLYRFDRAVGAYEVKLILVDGFGTNGVLYHACNPRFHSAYRLSLSRKSTNAAIRLSSAR